MEKKNAKHSTVLEDDDYAVTWSPTKGYTIRVPKMAEDAAIPPEALGLLAAFLRLTNDDEEGKKFREDCVEWMDKQP